MSVRNSLLGLSVPVRDSLLGLSVTVMGSCVCEGLSVRTHVSVSVMGSVCLWGTLCEDSV